MYMSIRYIADNGAEFRPVPLFCKTAGPLCIFTTEVRYYPFSSVALTNGCPGWEYIRDVDVDEAGRAHLFARVRSSNMFGYCYSIFTIYRRHPPSHSETLCNPSPEWLMRMRAWISIN